MSPPSPAEIPQLLRQARAAQSAGQTDQALAFYRRVLLAKPDLAEVHFYVGQIYVQSRDPVRAETALRRALKLKPREPAIWQALASVLTGGKRKKLEREASALGIVLSARDAVAAVLQQIETGNAYAAEAAALALVMQAPGAAGPAYALGAARAAQGKWGSALGPLQKAVERDQTNSSARVLLAEAWLETGQVSLAEPTLRQAQDDGLPVAAVLARLLMETCQPEDAIEVLQAAVNDTPSADLYRLLGQALAILRRPLKARAAYNAAIQAGGGPLLPDLARHLAHEGEAEAAIAVLDEALTAYPDHPGLLTQRAQLLQSGGDLGRAASDLRKVINAAPGLAEAYRAYTAAAKMTPDDPVIAQLEAQVARADLPAPARRTLRFAMAKAAGDMGRDPAEVFDHLNRANRLMRQDHPYDFQTDLTAARALVAEFTDRLRNLKSEGPADVVLFVTGLPRSGTTLVETVLGAHPEVTAGGELVFLSQSLAFVHDRLRQGDTPPPAAFADAGERYLRAARRRSGAGTGMGETFTDKAIATFWRIGHAALALPGAKFIALRRDPGDVGLSIYRNMFPPGTHRFSTDLRDTGRYIRLYEGLIDIWADLLPDRVVQVSYEALTETPEPQIRALVAAAGLEWDDACQSPQTAKRRVETLSFAQVRHPIYRSSVQGWRQFETELAPLFEGLAERPILR